MKINFKQCHSKNYSVGRTKAIKYLVIHYTSNNGDTAKNNIEYYASSTPIASAHYYVDEYDDVWQSVKDNDTAWHCGASTYKHADCRNANSIGIELCSRKDGNGVYYIKDKTVENAVALTRELMKKYNIPAENVIRHYDVTGKICPEPFVRDAAQWTAFKKALTAAAMISTTPAVPTTQAPAADKTQPATLTTIDAKYNLFGQKTVTIPSIMIDGNTYSNARILLEAMDFDVSWDAATATRVISVKSAVSAEDREIMYKIVQAEAGGEDEKGKVLVANVIMNRVVHKSFPNSIRDVVFQEQQFEPTRNGAYDKATPSAATKTAVDKALMGLDYSQGALFFIAVRSAVVDSFHERKCTFLFEHNGHRFYR